jgi:hypothetical protein
MKRFPKVARVGVLAVLCGGSGGCQLIVDFNRGLIDSGTVDGSFFDAGDAGFDAGVDALGVPDAQGDVLFLDGPVDAGMDASDGRAPGNPDATLDAASDGHVGDAVGDTTLHDAGADTAAGDAKTDVAPKDGAVKSDAVSDAPDAG